LGNGHAIPVDVEVDGNHAFFEGQHRDFEAKLQGKVGNGAREEANRELRADLAVWKMHHAV